MITFVKYAVYPMKYDVFISYRREGGSEFARSVKAELERKNYSVFLDFDELKDGKFDERILEAIAEAPVFLFILSSHSLDRCVNEDDWVRKEIEHAYSLGKHIIPVNKDGDFGHLPEGLPEPLVTIFATNQYSDIMVGQFCFHVLYLFVSVSKNPAKVRKNIRIVPADAKKLFRPGLLCLKIINFVWCKTILYNSNS